ncbi:MAG: hypothetical protein GAK28_04760 [Luteibacter sp.]|nr:MAG: hypothetical protein GAK28_04760 [Luteibacter sp.]
MSEWLRDLASMADVPLTEERMALIKAEAWATADQCSTRNDDCPYAPGTRARRYWDECYEERGGRL